LQKQSGFFPIQSIQKGEADSFVSFLSSRHSPLGGTPAVVFHSMMITKKHSISLRALDIFINFAV